MPPRERRGVEVALVDWSQAALSLHLPVETVCDVACFGHGCCPIDLCEVFEGLNERLAELGSDTASQEIDARIQVFSGMQRARG